MQFEFRTNIIIFNRVPNTQINNVKTKLLPKLFLPLLFFKIQWRLLCSRYQVAQAYMEDVNARVTIFAPVNDVFLYNPDLRAMDQKEVLSHIGIF